MLGYPYHFIPRTSDKLPHFVASPLHNHKVFSFSGPFLHRVLLCDADVRGTL